MSSAMFTARDRGIYERGRQSILARLREPDEALVEAYTAEMHRRGHHYIRKASVSELLQGFAATLADEEETHD